MAEEIGFKNGRISNFQGLVTLTLVGSYCIPSCITHRPLPRDQISLKLKNVYVNGRTYIRTYAWTDGHLRPALLGRLCGTVDLKRQLPPMYCIQYMTE